MSEFNGVSASKDVIPTIKEFEGFGEITVGGSVAGGDTNRVLFTALAVLNNPAVNSYLLANKLTLTDRVTKTRIFPREGMALIVGDVYNEPQAEVVELQENA